MLTAGGIYRLLVALAAPVQLRDVCVLMGPLFAGNTVRPRLAVWGVVLGTGGGGLVALG